MLYLSKSRLILSLLLGIVLMRNLQKWMTDYWVNSATPEIKKSAFVLVRRMLSMGVLVLLVGLSLSYDSAFLDSPGYKNSLRPGLGSGDTTLAVLTEWSFRSVARWQPVSEWMHHHVLRDFAFGRPGRPG